jgi:hypothetical protein
MPDAENIFSACADLKAAMELSAYFCERDRLILRSVTTCTLLSSSQFIL